MSLRLVSVFVGTSAVAALLPIAKARADILYNNGGIITHNDVGLGGADVSRASTNLSAVIGIASFRVSTAGQQSARVADDFTVPAIGWSVGSITGYACMNSIYPNPPVNSPITNCLFEIWSGMPTSGPDSGVVIASSTIITSNAWTGTYRITSGNAVTNARNPVWAVTADFGNLSLPAGNYWVSFNFEGLSPPPANGRTGLTPFVMTTDGSGNSVTVDGNGRDWAMDSSGAIVQPWHQFEGGNIQFQGVEYPFIVNGTPIPTPGAAALLGLGVLASSRRRRC